MFFPLSSWYQAAARAVWHLEHRGLLATGMTNMGTACHSGNCCKLSWRALVIFLVELIVWKLSSLSSLTKPPVQTLTAILDLFPLNSVHV